MIVVCPNCSTQFNFMAGEQAGSRVKLRCSVCKHVFTWPHETFELAEDVLVDGRDGAAGEKGADGGTHAGRHGRRRHLAGVLLLVSLVLALGLGAWLYYVQPAGIDIRGLRDTVMHRHASEDRTSGVVLDGIRQYWVRNDRIGRLMVIEGRIRNTGDEPKRHVAVDVALYDASNTQVGFRRQVVGNVLTLFQLQTLSEVELHEALDNGGGGASADTGIAPGDDVRFMAVMPNPQESTVEFGVRVAMAKTDRE